MHAATRQHRTRKTANDQPGERQVQRNDLIPPPRRTHYVGNDVEKGPR